MICDGSYFLFPKMLINPFVNLFVKGIYCSVVYLITRPKYLLSEITNK